MTFFDLEEKEQLKIIKYAVDNSAKEINLILKEYREIEGLGRGMEKLREMKKSGELDDLFKRSS